MDEPESDEEGGKVWHMPPLIDISFDEQIWADKAKDYLVNHLFELIKSEEPQRVPRDVEYRD
jgi:hypothetical protein